MEFPISNNNVSSEAAPDLKYNNFTKLMYNSLEKYRCIQYA